MSHENPPGPNCINLRNRLNELNYNELNVNTLCDTELFNLCWNLSVPPELTPGTPGCPCRKQLLKSGWTAPTRAPVKMLCFLSYNFYSYGCGWISFFSKRNDVSHILTKPPNTRTPPGYCMQCATFHCSILMYLLSRHIALMWMMTRFNS